MRIGIDARFYNESGVGRYLRNLITQLKILDKKNEYFIFLLQKDYEKLVDTKNFKSVCADFPWYGFAEQIKLPQILKRYNLDLVHFPHFNIPIFYTGKFVVTIHDLIHQHFQMGRATTLSPLTYKIKQMGYRAIFKNAISRSKKVLVPSEYVKKALENEWQLDSKKMTVTWEAVDNNLLNLSTQSKLSSVDVLNKFNIQPPYIFYVGNAHPHKNVESLIRAFMDLRQKYQYLQLVLVGQDHYFWQRIKKEFQHKDIIFTGFVSDKELVSLYKNAQTFVLPSYEEGFGIPILEAMACETPVVCSNAGSLPEVGGEAAIYFDPRNTEDIENKIDLVLKSQKIRQDLIKKGKERVKLFSWEQLAKQTLGVYDQCF